MAPAGRLNKLQNLDKVALQRAWTVPLLATKALLLQYTRAQTQYALLTWRQGQARREHWYPSLHPFVIVRKLWWSLLYAHAQKKSARYSPVGSVVAIPLQHNWGYYLSFMGCWVAWSEACLWDQAITYIETWCSAYNIIQNKSVPHLHLSGITVYSISQIHHDCSSLIQSPCHSWHNNEDHYCP